MKNKQWMEQEFFRTEALSPENLKAFGTSLIVAPHPDDEALGCGGLIRFLVGLHQKVYVVFVTHGGASHLHSKTHPKNKLIALREEEALKSCEILGVPPENVFFFREEDGALQDLQKPDKERIVQRFNELYQNKSVHTVFLPWRRDPHPDHQMSYELAHQAVKETAKNMTIVEYPIWLYKNSQQKDWPFQEEVNIFQLDIREQKAFKKLAVFAHRSQTSFLIKDDPEGFILTEDLLSPFMKDAEIYIFSRRT